MAKDSCLSKITTVAAFGAAYGAAYGVLLGTYGAFNSGSCDAYNRNPFGRRIPGLLKIRHVGQVTIAWTIIFGFLGGVGGGLIHYEMSQNEKNLIHYEMSRKEGSSGITNNKRHS